MGKVAWSRGEGPLVLFAQGYRQQLTEKGYSPSVVKAPHALDGAAEPLALSRVP